MLRPISVGAVLVLLASSLAAGASAQDYNPVQLTFSSSSDRHATWTADGQYVIFESKRTGKWHLFRVPAAGGTEEQISFGVVHEYNPEVSPDGTKIVFVQSESDPSDCSSSSLMVMPVGGGAPTQILGPDGNLNWHPTWSPDGNTIYYGSRIGGYWRISKVPAMGGSPTVIVALGNDARPIISPDGTRIVYAHYASGAYNVVDAPLSNPESFTPLTFETRNTVAECFTPDGQYLIYGSRKLSNWLELFKLELATSTTTRLTYDVGAYSYDPLNQLAQVDPTGTTLAFSSKRETAEENIWLTGLDVTPQPTEILSVLTGQGVGGGGPARVPIALSCTVSTPAIEFRLHDLPDWLTVTGVEMEGRAALMSASFADDGSAHVIVYSPTGRSIGAGAGTIMNLLVSVDPAAQMGDSVALSLSDIVMSDGGGNPVTVTTRDGVFRIERIPGDINLDNLIDVGDLVRLVEIILGTGAAPAPDELSEADCNDDGVWNALDIPCLLGLILGGSGSPAPGVIPLAEAGDVLRLFLESEVRGFQFELPAEAADPVPTVDLGAFSLNVGYGANGRKLVILFDPAGGGWSTGALSPLEIDSVPGNFRAYGPGGRPLPVKSTDDGLRIGVTPPSRLTMLAPAPNPFRAGTAIRFSTPAPGPVRIRIYDVSGALVSSLPARNLPAGEHEWTWTAVDDRNRPLAAGFYIAVVESGGSKASVRLTHLAD